MFDNKRIFKEPNKINFPDDNEIMCKKASIYELLLETEGDYKKVSQILDHKIIETNHLIKELTENIKSLADDTFEEKLNQLKNDNYETMLLCDEFRKIASRKEKEQENFELKNYDNGYVSRENSKKIHEKPPQIPNRTPTYNNGKDINNHHSMYGNEFDETHSLDSFGRSHSYDKVSRLWKENEDIDNEEDINKREKNYKREAAMERLTKSRTNIPKYGDDSDKSHLYFDPDALVAKWRHKVTVPQPFEMTVREETKKKYLMNDKNKFRKSRTLLEFQAEKLEKERQELEETKKQFKANPVPAHVFIPLYETMQEESNQRRQFIKEYNKEILKSIEKPFNFYKRDLEKQKQRSESCYSMTDTIKTTNTIKTYSNKAPLKSYHGERQRTIIRAKEAPKVSKDSLTTEKMKEEELFRLIKAEMRSKQLLEESKMPGNMAERQRIQEEKQRKKQLKNTNSSLRVRSQSADSGRNHKSIPDFNKIHREWEEEIRMSYKEPFVTQPKPFNLLTDQRPLNRSTNDIMNSSNNNLASSYAATKNEWNKSILAALEIAKPSTNKSTMLREQAVKSKLIDDQNKMHNKAIEQLARKKREMDASEKIRKSLDIDALPKGEDKRRQKTKELKIQNERRKEDYHRELEEIKKKVDQKPLLLETPLPKSRPSNGYNKEYFDIHKRPNKKQASYNEYDEKNNFGDPSSFRSSTDVSESMEGGRSNSYRKNDHLKQWNEEIEDNSQ